MTRKYYFLLIPAVLLNLLFLSCRSQEEESKKVTKIIPGAERTSLYFDLIKGKKIAVIANHTSLVGTTGLIDTLITSGIVPKLIFSPEHGFGGSLEAGEKVANQYYKSTQIPLISLYGKNLKPKPKDLQGIDLVLFDIQDVGVRFYTYISTLSYAMEACAENGKPLIILDRPNPNGFYIDGPVLEMRYSSFVGMHPIPIVYGMTEGELAQMINGEGWLKNHVKCDLSVIPVENYTHSSFYELPVKPSPNLPDMQSILLYPSLCLFEGTIMSVGRGTDKPFKIFGHPDYNEGDFSFVPKRRSDTNLSPLYEGITCKGFDLSALPGSSDCLNGKICLEWLIRSYNYFKRPGFFNSYFNQLAGNDELRNQIMAGMSEDKIRESWQNDLNIFREKRKRYMIYKD